MASKANAPVYLIESKEIISHTDNSPLQEDVKDRKGNYVCPLRLDQTELTSWPFFSKCLLFLISSLSGALSLQHMPDAKVFSLN